MQVDRGLGLGASVGWASAAFAHLGETGVGGGTGGIGSDGGLELLFGLGDQALGEVVMAELGVLCGLLCGGKRGQTGGAHLVELEGCLAERSLGIGSANAFERREV